MTLMRILDKAQRIAIDFDDLINYLDTDECDGKNESNDFNMVKPDLIDFIVVSNGDSNQISVPSATLGSLTITTSAVLFQVFSISISLV